MYGMYYFFPRLAVDEKSINCQKARNNASTAQVKNG